MITKIDPCHGNTGLQRAMYFDLGHREVHWMNGERVYPCRPVSPRDGRMLMERQPGARLDANPFQLRLERISRCTSTPAMAAWSAGTLVEPAATAG